MVFEWLFGGEDSEEQTTPNTSDTSQQSDSSQQSETSSDDEEKKKQEEKKSEDEEKEEEFHVHKGKIIGIKPYTQISSVSWDKSYDSPTGTSKTKLIYDKNDTFENKKFIYKGVSCKVKLRRTNEKKFTPTLIEETGLSEDEIKQVEHYPTKEQQEEIDTYFANQDLLNEDISKSEREKAEEQAEKDKPYSRSDNDAGLYGFVTDVTQEDNGTELEIKDWGYCLEDNTKKLSFSNMMRSQILEEVIKSYGLVPVVDFTGLKDDSISWTNVTSSGDSSDSNSETVGDAKDGRSQCSGVLDVLSYNQNDGGGTPISKLMEGFSPTPESLGKIGKEDTNYGKAVKGKSPKEAYKILKNGWHYCGYANNRDKCATESFDKRGSPGLNCGDSARLLKCAMDVVGCPCVVLHVTNHYMNAVKIDGEWKTADLCYSGSGRYPEYNTAGFNS